MTDTDWTTLRRLHEAVIDHPVGSYTVEALAGAPGVLVTLNLWDAADLRRLDQHLDHAGLTRRGDNTITAVDPAKALGFECVLVTL